MRPTISTDELRAAAAGLLERVEHELGPTIDLAADHYWRVDSAEAFDMSAAPLILAGQLSDDVDSLRSTGDSGRSTLGQELDHLVGVLRRLAALAG